MEFDLAEDAARFAADLGLDYGPETVVELVGLDALDMPLDQPFEAPFEPEAFGAWLAAYDVAPPELRHFRDQLLD